MLAEVFRGRYLDGFRRGFDGYDLTFAGRAAAWVAPGAFAAFLATLRECAWVVYAKPPFADPARVLEYLGRYAHRVAISNDRLVSLEAGQVRFRWKDYTRGKRWGQPICFHLARNLLRTSAWSERWSNSRLTGSCHSPKLLQTKGDSPGPPRPSLHIPE